MEGPFYFALKRSNDMHKNLMGKLIKSNNINRGEYTYIYSDNELVDIATNGGKQYSRNTAFDGRFDENA
jgi:hypothetical protein